MTPSAKTALLLFPFLPGVLLVVFFIAFVPYNPGFQDHWINTGAGEILIAAYFVVGLVVGTIPIIRSQVLTVSRKLSALAGYEIAAFAVLYLFFVIALSTRIVI